MTWQDYIAIGLLMLASHFVIKRVIATWFGPENSGCGGGCGTCGGNVAKERPKLLAIDSTPVQRSP